VTTEMSRAQAGQILPTRATFLYRLTATLCVSIIGQSILTFRCEQNIPPKIPASHIFADEGLAESLSEFIRNISRNVAVREFISIFDPNGYGKSALLMMIAGLIERTDGEILINAEPVTGPRREGEVGVTFQQRLPLPWQTVLDNVPLPIELRKPPRSKLRQRAMDLLPMAKIGDFAHHLPRQFLGGMGRRASICHALIHDPSILLVDEPFALLTRSPGMRWASTAHDDGEDRGLEHHGSCHLWTHRACRASLDLLANTCRHRRDEPQLSWGHTGEKTRDVIWLASIDDHS
jgi:ABC-type lipoprotein export system ATPase subunit